jgi:hypothetical protein
MTATHIQKMFGAFGRARHLVLLISLLLLFLITPFVVSVRLWRRDRRAALGNVRFRGAERVIDKNLVVI